MRGRQHTLSSGAEGAEADLSGIGNNKTNRISSTNKSEYSPIRSPGIVAGQPSSSIPSQKSSSSSTPTSSRVTSTSSRASQNATHQSRSGKGPVTSLSAASTTPGGGPGRTPQTRRKELSLQQQPASFDTRSPVSSPRTANSPRVSTSTSQQSKKSRRSQEEDQLPVRKTSTSSLTKESNSRSGSRKSPLRSNVQNLRLSPQISLDSEGNDRSSKYFRHEKTKFDELWDCKTIEHGLIRIPTQRLEDLISKERIEKVYEVDEKPVAR